MERRAAAAVLCLLTLFAPVRGEAAFWSEFGLQEEMKMGRDFDALVRTTMPLVEDPAVEKYVQSVVDRIVAPLPPQPYKFPAKVILQDMLNAFAAPGGFIFVYSGLIMNLEHESELAGVLSHEVAHVVQRHIASRMERGSIVSMASLLGMVAGLAAAAAGGGSSVGGAAVFGSMAAGSAAMLGYSRTDEDDADRCGLRYLAGAGWNPKGLGGAFELLRSSNWGLSSSVPAYLTTHPDLNARLAGLRANLQAMQPSLLARPERDGELRRVQALLWGRCGDPAQAEHFFASHGADRPECIMGRAILDVRRGRVKDAARGFSRALQLAPRDGLILREAGIFEYERGDAARARELLERALPIRKDDCYAQFYLARILDDSGDRAGAQRLYLQVLRAVPMDAEVHMHLGRSLGASGKLCEGYLHLAYSALYSGDDRRASSMLGKARAAKKTDSDARALGKYEEDAKEHARVMKEAKG